MAKTKRQYIGELSAAHDALHAEAVQAALQSVRGHSRVWLVRAGVLNVTRMVGVGRKIEIDAGRCVQLTPLCWCRLDVRARAGACAERRLPPFRRLWYHAIWSPFQRACFIIGGPSDLRANTVWLQSVDYVKRVMCEAMPVRAL
jgi:hypothetical protein